jgi:hypothetical protein
MPFVDAIWTQINIAHEAPERFQSVQPPISVTLLLPIVINVLPDVVAILASHIGGCFDNAMKLSIKTTAKHTTIADVCFCNFCGAFILQKVFEPTLTAKIPLPVIFLLQTG